MNFYKEASIAIIPNAYKAGKIYSARPGDGSGDLSFTRASATATRVNASGILEECRTNILLNSATLATQSVTVAAAPYTLSIFGTGSVTLSGTGSGTLTGTGAANRVTLTFTPTAGTLTLTVAGSVTSAQLEIGDIATDYIATTGAAVTVGPIANIPRLDYTGGGCSKLLLEPQRTNRCLYSEQFNNAAYTLQAGTLTANNTTSPDGYQNADLFVETAATSSHSIGCPIVTTGLYTAAQSVFVKNAPNGRGFIQLSGAAIWSGTANNFHVNFDIINGTVTASNGATGLIVNYGNGWFRCIAVSTCTIEFEDRLRIRSITDGSAGYAQSFAGDITKGFYVYGSTFEQGGFATSYIPTWNASVTRTQEEIIKSSITSLIGQTEGTLFLDFDFDNQSVQYIGLSDNTTSNRVIIGASAANTITAIVSSGGSDVATISKTDAVLGQKYKCAIGYKLNDFVFYVNGQLIGSDISGAVPTTLTQIINSSGLTASRFFKPINQILVYKTRLSNTDLQTLTTL